MCIRDSYHGDHDSDDKGMKIRNNFHVRQFIDYNTYPTGYEWELDGVTIKILNSFAAVSYTHLDVYKRQGY